MLGAGRNSAGLGEVLALEAPHHCRTQNRREIGVFTETLGDATPARIPCDIDHGRERPVDAGPRGLPRSNPSAPAHDVGIPACRLSEGNRHHGLEPVDHVATDQQRDAESAFFDGDALQLVDHLDVDFVEHGPDTAGAQRLRQVVVYVAVADIHLAHLADLLDQSHTVQQFSDALLDRVSCRMCHSAVHQNPQGHQAERGIDG